MQSTWSWTILFVMALFVGMSKTGVQGLTILTVPLLAMTFGAKHSTGLMLPVLCFADLIGVSYYRRKAEWRYIMATLILPLPWNICVWQLQNKTSPPAGFVTSMPRSASNSLALATPKNLLC